MKLKKQYVPDSLTKEQKKKQIKSIVEGKDRPKLKGVKTRRSKWTQMAHDYFGGKAPSLQQIRDALGLKSIRPLKQIIKRGESAYYSSGSRPNVSAVQWSIARLHAVIFGSEGARKADGDIIKKHKIGVLKKGGIKENILSNKPNLKELKSYSLSNFDIHKALEPSVPIHTYPDLKQMFSIDEALDKQGRGIVLVLTENENVGHWIALVKNGDTVEVYDPYGFKPDDHNEELEVAPQIQHTQDDTLLRKLIEKSGYGFKYNKFQHQSLNRDVATCGRHSVMRLVFKDLDNDQYNKIIKCISKETGMNPDELAVEFTHELIGK